MATLNASGDMIGASTMDVAAQVICSASGAMVGASEMAVSAVVASRLLPTYIPRFKLPLPWETVIGGTPVTEVTVDFQRTAFREYSGGGEYDMHAAIYANNGAGATPGLNIAVTVVCNVSSFGDVGQAFKEALLQQLLAAWARYQLTLLAIIQKPEPTLPDPPGIAWPLTQAVVDYVNGGGSVIPRPRGTFAAFRLVPSGDYATVDELIDIYRGTPL